MFEHLLLPLVVDDALKLIGLVQILNLLLQNLLLLRHLLVWHGGQDLLKVIFLATRIIDLIWHLFLIRSLC